MMAHKFMVAAVLLVYSLHQTFSRDCPEIPPIARYLHVISKIEMRFATTHVISYVTNVANKSQEIKFQTVLPKEAYISSFVMEVNGIPIAGSVKEKKQAKKEYQQAKEQGLTAGHISTTEIRPSVFETSINVAARAKVRFNLTYQEILTRSNGVYKHAVSLLPDYTAEKVRLDVVIADRYRINSLHVVNGKHELADMNNNALLDMQGTEFERRVSKFDSNLGVQKLVHVTVRDQKGLIVVLYDLKRPHSGSQIETAGGYFIHYYTVPNTIIPGARHVVFVLDKSGSMDGRKIQQLKEAMRLTFDTLRVSDKFGIVVFDHKINTYKAGMIPTTDENRRQAQEYIEEINADGGTNIHEALESAVTMLNTHSTSSYHNMIFFLTDGEATSGETNETLIINQISTFNERGHRIYCLSFGDDAHYGFLSKVSNRNRGFARRIFLESFVSSQIKGVFDQASNVLLEKLNVTYFDDSVDVNTIATNNHVNEFRKGDEVIYLGKLRNMMSQQMVTGVVSGNIATGTVLSVPATSSNITWGGTLLCTSTQRHQLFIGGVSCRNVNDSSTGISAEVSSGAYFGGNTAAGFLERMFAYQTIKQLIYQAYYEATSPAEAQFKLDEALQTSLKYQFVTELTSMVLVAPDLKNLTFNASDAQVSLDPWVDQEEQKRNQPSLPRIHGLSRPSSSRVGAPNLVPPSGGRGLPGLPGPRGSSGGRGILGSSGPLYSKVATGSSSSSSRSRVFGSIAGHARGSIASSGGRSIGSGPVFGISLSKSIKQPDTFSKSFPMVDSVEAAPAAPPPNPNPSKDGFFQEANAALDALQLNALLSFFNQVPVSDYSRVRWRKWFPKLLSSLSKLNSTQVSELPWKDLWSMISAHPASNLCWSTLVHIPAEDWVDVPVQVVQNLHPPALSSLPMGVLKSIPLDHLKALNSDHYRAFTMDILEAIDRSLLVHALSVVTGRIDP